MCDLRWRDRIIFSLRVPCACRAGTKTPQLKADQGASPTNCKSSSRVEEGAVGNNCGAAVVKPDGHGGAAVVARITAKDWASTRRMADNSDFFEHVVRVPW